MYIIYKKAVFFLLVLIFFAFSALVAGSTGEQVQSMPGMMVILHHDDRYISRRVPAPKRALLEIESENITVNYNPASCEGSITPWPPEAQVAFDHAVSIWEALITSKQMIVVNACWRSDLGAGVLGAAGPLTFVRDFTNAPIANTWYPIGLANSLAGRDLNENEEEIMAFFSSRFDWYFGTDGNTPSNQVDFVSVVLHEVGHGLGFLGSMIVENGAGSWGFGSGSPFIYDHFTEDGSGTTLLTYSNHSRALGNALTGDADGVFFNGTNANAANGDSWVKLYTPRTWRQGSSYSHLNEIFNNTPNALMTFSLSNGQSEHDPGPVTLGMFADMGWVTSGGTTPTATPSLLRTPTPTIMLDGINTPTATPEAEPTATATQGLQTLTPTATIGLGGINTPTATPEAESTAKAQLYLPILMNMPTQTLTLESLSY